MYKKIKLYLQKLMKMAPRQGCGKLALQSWLFWCVNWSCKADTYWEGFGVFHLLFSLHISAEYDRSHDCSLIIEGNQSDKRTIHYVLLLLILVYLMAFDLLIKHYDYTAYQGEIWTLFSLLLLSNIKELSMGILFVFNWDYLDNYMWLCLASIK